MISEFELIAIFLLIIVLGILVWFYFIGNKRSTNLNNWRYTRGANLVEGTNKNQVQLTCDSNHVIFVDKAHQICTSPDANNFESTNLEYSSTNSNNYGNFPSNTTVDLTIPMRNECNGKTSYTYTFTPSPYPNGVACNGTNHLIATYTCIPKDQANSFSVSPTAVPNRWIANEIFLYQSNGSCLTPIQSNAVGWKFTNNTSSVLQLYMLGGDNQSSCFNKLLLENIPAAQTNPNVSGFVSWLESTSNRTFNTIFSNCGITINVMNGNSTRIYMNQFPDIQGGDIIDIVAKDNNGTVSLELTNERTQQKISSQI